MSKQTPAEVAAEQANEVGRWLLELDQRRYDAEVTDDYATVAALHQSLTRVVRGMQLRDNATKGGDATD